MDIDRIVHTWGSGNPDRINEVMDDLTLFEISDVQHHISGCDELVELNRYLVDIIITRLDVVPEDGEESEHDKFKRELFNK